jgi:hypothetical protein
MTARAEPDVFARLTGMSELSLAVRPDHDLGAVVVDVTGLPGDWQAVLARNNAIDLADRILQACIALRSPDQPPGVPLSGC